MPEEFLLDNGLAVKAFPFDVPATKRIVRGGSFKPALRFRGPLGQGRARVVFILNGFPLDEIVLDGAAADEQVTDIDLPASLLRPGKNTMTLAAMIEQKSGVKGGEDSLDILDGSILRLDYLDASDFNLGDLAAFLEGGPPFPDRGLVVVIPDKPGSEEVQAAMELLLQWYRGFPRGTASGSVLSAGSVTPGIANSSHMIYLGRSRSFPRSVLEAFRGNPPAGGQFLSCFVNYGAQAPGRLRDGRGSLAVPSPAGPWASWTFSTRRCSYPMKAPPPKSVRSRRDQVTFKDLTGGDLVFSGAGKSSRRVEHIIPPGGLVGGRSEVSLSFRSSPLIDGDRSTLTLFLDGVPAASVDLGKSAIGKDQMTTRIPKVLLEGSTLRWG